MHVLEVREKITLGLSELQDRLFPLISGMTAKNPPIHIRINRNPNITKKLEDVFKVKNSR